MIQLSNDFDTYLEKVERGGGETLTFKEAEEALKVNYDQPERELTALRRLRYIRQRGSIQDYNTALEEALRNLRMLQNVGEKWAIKLYLMGLEERTAVLVFRRSPKTCVEAMEIATAEDYGTSMERNHYRGTA